jgi:hypothetical protein
MNPTTGAAGITADEFAGIVARAAVRRADLSKTTDADFRQARAALAPQYEIRDAPSPGVYEIRAATESAWSPATRAGIIRFGRQIAEAAAGRDADRLLVLLRRASDLFGMTIHTATEAGAEETETAEATAFAAFLRAGFAPAAPDLREEAGGC